LDGLEKTVRFLQDLSLGIEPTKTPLNEFNGVLFNIEEIGLQALVLIRVPVTCPCVFTTGGGFGGASGFFGCSGAGAACLVCWTVFACSASTFALGANDFTLSLLAVKGFSLGPFEAPRGAVAMSIPLKI
jgi:hypothetical protein